MSEMDTIERAWRQGLEHGAANVDNAGVHERVERRLTARRHRRIAGRAVAAVCAAALVAGGALALRPSSKTQPVTPLHKVAVVADPNGDLTIVFPSTGTSQIQLPPGSYEFDITAGSAGHALAIAGPHAANTEVRLDRKGEVAPLRTVLEKGTYELHCDIPGHTAGGESATIVVR